jgi:predicted  nucleic acid-binding Zn-ribbon protein
MMYRCPKCGEVFPDREKLIAHTATHVRKPKFITLYFGTSSEVESIPLSSNARRWLNVESQTLDPETKRLIDVEHG